MLECREQASVQWVLSSVTWSAPKLSSIQSEVRVHVCEARGWHPDLVARHGMRTHRSVVDPEQRYSDKHPGAPQRQDRRAKSERVSLLRRGLSEEVDVEVPFEDTIVQYFLWRGWELHGHLMRNGGS